LKVVEESSGIGELIMDGVTLCQVTYRFSRFQGVMESGLPIPGLHRIEGSIEFHLGTDPHSWINVPLTLKLQDGRMLGITLVNTDGRILSEGHGPAKCLCC
jgi:hypothetical protein